MKTCPGRLAGLIAGHYPPAQQALADSPVPSLGRGFLLFRAMRRRETAYTVALIICTVCLIVALGQQAWALLNPG